MSSQRQIVADWAKKNKSRVFPPAIKYDDIPESLEYQPDRKLFKFGLHNGQRKLGLSEIQFITQNPSEFYVYAGAAPSQKGYLLSLLFPKIRLILVDPNPFRLFVDENRTQFPGDVQSHPDIQLLDKQWVKSADSESLVDHVRYSSHKIFLINDFFTDTLAKKLAPLRANFVCDIRTRDESMESPSDLDIVWNLAQQFNWMQILNPPASCLKFRAPFYADKDHFTRNHTKSFYKNTFDLARQFGVDFVKDYFSKTLRYTPGEIFLQAWQPRSSTESRLHVKDVGSLVDYDVLDYEGKFHFYNSTYRVSALHDNLLFKLGKIDKALAKRIESQCIDHCNDCAIEADIWNDYIKRFLKQKPTPAKIVERFELITKYTAPLCTMLHGKINSPEKIEENIRIYSHEDYTPALNAAEKARTKKTGKGEKDEENVALVVLIVLLVLLSFAALAAVYASDASQASNKLRDEPLASDALLAAALN
jgi:hypothetical protein